MPKVVTLSRVTVGKGKDAQLHEAGETVEVPQEIVDAHPTVFAKPGSDAAKKATAGSPDAGAVTPEDESTADDKALGELSREELDERASDLGVENPEGLKTKDDVIEAIKEAQGA